MRIHTVVALAGLAVLGVQGVVPDASAQQAGTRIYTCKDASGKTITSDRPLPECQGREGRVLSNQGTTLKTIEAPLTPEQQAVREVEEEKKKEAALKRAEQLRKDKALLNTYQNLDDLESKRQRALLQVEREMKDAERRVSFLVKQEQEYKQEEEFYKKKKMPVELKRKLDENEGALRAERLLLTSKKDEITQVNLKFDEDKKRYLELSGAAAKAAKK
jgi:hypothetical protein